MSKTKAEIVDGNSQLAYCIMPSPIGELLLVGDGHGLRQIKFECHIQINKNWIKNTQLFKNEVSQLNEYFDGERTQFSIKVNPQGTTFQKSVWRQLQKIQSGETKYYSQIAQELDNPNAARAIGMANNKNPIPIIIPCHRVIGKNGNLVGFASGLKIKHYLLELESIKPL